jgi:hypothetical protein
MRLDELEPRWLLEATPDHWRWTRDGQQFDKQGVVFLCPACFKTNGGKVGTHSIICWFEGRGVPAEVTPGIARWPVSGTGFHDLTLTPSVDAGCWHGHVTNGEIVGGI